MGPVQSHVYPGAENPVYLTETPALFRTLGEKIDRLPVTEMLPCLFCVLVTKEIEFCISAPFRGVQIGSGVLICTRRVGRRRSGPRMAIALLFRLGRMDSIVADQWCHALWQPILCD